MQVSILPASATLLHEVSLSAFLLQASCGAPRDCLVVAVPEAPMQGGGFLLLTFWLPLI
jgi:hypothetical protein